MKQVYDLFNIAQRLRVQSEPDPLTIIRKMARDGATHNEIAAVTGLPASKVERLIRQNGFVHSKLRSLKIPHHKGSDAITSSRFKA